MLTIGPERAQGEVRESLFQFFARVEQFMARVEASLPHAMESPRIHVWALERGYRSGRVAWQFARDYAGKYATLS